MAKRALGIGIALAAVATFVIVIGSSPLRVSPENLVVGDCFHARDFSEFDVEIVDCGQPHDAEVLAPYVAVAPTDVVQPLMDASR